MPDRARQAAALLDALEVAGDDTFAAFLGLLRDQHRQLHSVLDETRRCLDDEDDDQGKERIVLAGDTVRRLLRRYDGGRDRGAGGGDDTTSAGVATAASSGSIDDLSAADEPCDHVPCFTVPTRGRRLQPESWIRHSTVDDDHADGPLPTPAPFQTLVTTRDLIFRRVEVPTLRHVSGRLRLPPSTIAAVYVADNDYVPDIQPVDVPSPTGTMSDCRGTLVPSAANSGEPAQMNKTR